jgi:hypothetical protein
MSWARLDDRFFDNPKVCALSADAKLLHLSGIVWCAGNLTDGHIASASLPLVAAKAHSRLVHKADRYVRELVAAGLWLLVEGGWDIHDFLEYNPSRAETTARRAADSERKRKGRATQESARNPNGVGSDAWWNP